MMTMAGKIPAFFLPVPGQSTKEVAAGSALPGHAGHGLVGFQLCGLSVVCGLQGKVNRCGHPVPPSRLP